MTADAIVHIKTLTVINKLGYSCVLHAEVTEHSALTSRQWLISARLKMSVFVPIRSNTLVCMYTYNAWQAAISVIEWGQVRPISPHGPLQVATTCISAKYVTMYWLRWHYHAKDIAGVYRWSI